MTIIEFFDENAILNAFSTLLLRPARLILFGGDLSKMHTFARHLEALLSMRNQKTDIQVVGIDADNHAEISKRLEKIITSYPDSVFDVTGGDTPLLVSIGALSARYGIPMHTANPPQNTISVLSGEYPALEGPVALSAEEIITLYGGRVTEAFAPSFEDTAFLRDVASAWAVCRKNCAAWNTAVGAMHTAFPNHDKLTLSASISEIEKKLSPEKYEKMKDLLKALSEKGLISNLRIGPQTISFTYKNEAIRHLLGKAGTALEMHTYYTSCSLSTFTDAKTGIVIDWQSDLRPRFGDAVTNEIDVFLTSGVIPVFISCKNGLTNTDELYKLSVVAERFGGDYAKKIIVLTQFVPDDAFMERARELGIFVIYNVHRMSDAFFAERISLALQHKF